VFDFAAAAYQPIPPPNALLWIPETSTPIAAGSSFSAQSRSFVNSNMIGFVTFDHVLRQVARCMVCVTLELNIPCHFADDHTAYPPSF
jgi:hypothetical protein